MYILHIIYRYAEVKIRCAFSPQKLFLSLKTSHNCIYLGFSSKTYILQDYIWTRNDNFIIHFYPSINFTE